MDTSEQFHGDAAERRALMSLRELASGLDWRAQSSESLDVGADIVAATPEGQICVQVRRLGGANRVDSLKGAAAMAILDLQRSCPDQSKVVWLEVDRVGAQAVEKLGQYLLEVAPDVGWAVVDANGGARIVVPALGLDLSEEPAVAPSPSSKTHTALFSDLNSWMLKILLMRRAPDWAWTSTRERCRNAHVLHSIAEVSVASAHRFVRAMTEADHLRADRRGLHLVRVDALMHRWRAVHQSQPPVAIEARPLFEFDHRQLDSTLAGGRVALGGWFAAEQFGFAHATRGRRTIWTESALEDALAALDLVRAEPGRGQLWIGRPRQIESCFRARVFVDGLPFVDPCQLMLECATDPVRGFEQSEYILSRILDWQEDAGVRDR